MAALSKGRYLVTTRTPQTLLGRKTLDEARPWGQALLSVAALANSLITTVACAVDARNLARPDFNIGVTIVIGVILAFSLTVAQVLTSDVSTLGYLIALTPDALMTAIQWREWFLVPLFNALMPGLGGVAMAWTVAILIGLVSAYIPERMIFGKRRVFAK